MFLLWIHLGKEKGRGLEVPKEESEQRVTGSVEDPVALEKKRLIFFGKKRG